MKRKLNNESLEFSLLVARLVDRLVDVTIIESYISYKRSI